jgi:hypothetical protein
MYKPHLNARNEHADFRFVRRQSEGNPRYMESAHMGTNDRQAVEPGNAICSSGRLDVGSGNHINQNAWRRLRWISRAVSDEFPQPYRSTLSGLPDDRRDLETGAPARKNLYAANLNRRIARLLRQKATAESNLALGPHLTAETIPRFSSAQTQAFPGPTTAWSNRQRQSATQPSISSCSQALAWRTLFTTTGRTGERLNAAPYSRAAVPK